MNGHDFIEGERDDTCRYCKGRRRDVLTEPCMSAPPFVVVNEGFPYPIKVEHPSDTFKHLFKRDETIKVEFTAEKPTGDPALRAQLDTLREKGRISLTDYQLKTPACGVAPLELSRPMAKLRTIHELHATKCEDAECLLCGVLSCPLGEPMHFHHDGCPACPETE